MRDLLNLLDNILAEEVNAQFAPELEGMKDVISRRIKDLPDDPATAKALKEIEDLLSHIRHGGRLGSISKEIEAIQDQAVQSAKKVLARLAMNIMEEVDATPVQRAEFFNTWKNDELVNTQALLSNEKVDFAVVFTGYTENPVTKEFVDEVMMIQELGMGRGEFGLNVLSKSITVAGKSSKEDNDEDSGSKKGDLQIKSGGKIYQVELKTEMGGAARFGDQEVRPAEGFEASAVALNNFVKSHPAYKNLSRKLSGSGMNLNQAIDFNQLLDPASSDKFLTLLQRCISLIFGNTSGSRKEYATRLKKNINGIMSAIATGDSGEAAQQWSQASFNYYMSKKHDDGVLYLNLNSKIFIYYNDAEQLLAQGLRFHASTPYISATKDPVRSVYPQIGVQQTSFGGDAAQQGLKQALKTKTVDPDQINQVVSNFARRRGVTDPNTINQLTQKMTDWVEFGRAGGITADELIAELERQYPKLASKVSVQQPAGVSAPAQEPVARLTGPGAKAARNPAQPQMTAEVLGRERR
jgi:hypothetical protein